MSEDLEILTYVCTVCGHNEDFEEGDNLDGWTAVQRVVGGWGPSNVYVHDPCTDTASEDTSHTLYCDGCTDEELAACMHCGEWGHRENSDMREVNYDWVCIGCFEDRYSMCDDCEDIVDRDYMMYVEGGDRGVCEGCRDYYNCCCGCDEYYHCDSGYWGDDDDYSDEWWCSYCYEQSNDSPRNTVVQSYGFRPILMFRWSHDRERHGFWMQNHTSMVRRAKFIHFYGTELEVEPAPGKGADSNIVREEAEYIHENYGDFLYLKRDSSVPAGFEIVSHPATLEWWLTHGTKMYADILVRLRNAGFQSHNGNHCGLHIHTNKAAISPLQRMRMTEFIFNENNRMKIKLLSRRTNSSLQSYANLDIPSHYDDARDEYIAMDSKEYAKYVGRTGMSRNRNALYFGRETGELRLFRGTLRDDRLWASLEFYDLLIQYCKDSSTYSPRWNNFRSYVHAAPREYSDLQSYFMEKQL